MISIPYTYIAIAFCLLVVFFKMGEMDEEIGWVMGLAAGVLVLLMNHFFPGGYLRLGLYAVGGFALLTVYKIVRSTTERRGPDEEENTDRWE